jgi:hypothetical protein
MHFFWIMCLHIFFFYTFWISRAVGVRITYQNMHTFSMKKMRSIMFICMHTFTSILYSSSLTSVHTHTHAHIFSSSFTSVVHTHIYICKVTLRLLNLYVNIADVAEWSRALNIRLRRLVLQCITVGV